MGKNQDEWAAEMGGLARRAAEMMEMLNSDLWDISHDKKWSETCVTP